MINDKIYKIQFTKFNKLYLKQLIGIDFNPIFWK